MLWLFTRPQMPGCWYFNKAAGLQLLLHYLYPMIQPNLASCSKLYFLQVVYENFTSGIWDLYHLLWPIRFQHLVQLWSKAMYFCIISEVHRGWDTLAGILPNYTQILPTPWSKASANLKQYILWLYTIPCRIVEVAFSTIKRQISVQDLFIRIVRVKRQSHKFVPHKFLSHHTLQCTERGNTYIKIA